MSSIAAGARTQVEAKGLKQRLASRGTAAPLSPTENTCPQWLETGDVDNFRVKPQSSAYTRPGSANQPTYSAFVATPSPPKNQTPVSPPKLQVRDPCAPR